MYAIPVLPSSRGARTSRFEPVSTATGGNGGGLLGPAPPSNAAAAAPPPGYIPSGSMYFRTPNHFPNPLWVRPPSLDPHQRRPTTRWSDNKYCNADVPNYVPPELLLFGDGKPLEAFLQRAALEDMRRMQEKQIEGLWFMRKHGELPPRFTGTPLEAMCALRERRMKEFLDASRHHQMQDAELLLAQQRNMNRITRKIYFTKEQMDTGVFGALFGSRGATQKLLQAETKCKIVLGGRGITDLKKASSLRDMEAARKLAEEEPHVAISAPTEQALRSAVQRIEFLLSDDPEAVRTREENKRRGEIDNGVVFSAPPSRPGGGPSARSGDANRQPDDEDVANFLATL